MAAGNLSSLLLLIVPLMGLFLFAAVIIIVHLRTVPPDQIYVIERNRRYFIVWESGVHLLIPLQDRIAKIIPRTVQQKVFPLEYLRTKDEQNLRVSARMSYHISDFQHTSDGGDPHEGAAHLYEYTLRTMAEHLKAEEMIAERAEMERLLRNALQSAYPQLGITLDSLELSEFRHI